jgi:predicted Zn-dependent protease
MSATVYPEPTGASLRTPPPSCSKRPERARRVPGLQTIALGAIAALTPSCLSLIPIQQDIALGQNAYSQILEEGTPIVATGSEAAMVQGVTDRLVEAVVQQDPEFEAFPWEVTLLDSPMVNAFCLPGGKMAVYTGILPFTQSEAGLAVVMGHEIAHATQRHGIEKVRNGALSNFGVAVAAEYGIDPAILQTAGDVLLHLPYGRGQELEADHYGLFYMAAAGYDPREAADFWRRMSAAAGEKPPELLSTHPSDQTRIDRIEALLPDAIRVYEQAIGSGSLPSP